LKISILPDSRYEIKGDDLLTTQQVDLYTLILGGEVKVQAPDKKVSLTIPPETPNGTSFRLSGLGMPQQGKSSKRGDLYVKVQAKLPQELSERERNLFKELRDAHGKGGN
jgi:curved DNA-binding protein